MDVSLLVLLLYIGFNRYFIQPHGFSIRFIELLGLGFLYLVLRRLPLKSYPWLFLTVVFSGVVQAVYGNLQLFGYYPSLHSGFNISGSYFNPGPYAGFLAAVWPFALGTYLFKDKIVSITLFDQKKISPWQIKIVNGLFYYIPLIGISTIIIVLPATRSRAAWLSVLVATLFLAGYRYRVLEKIKALTPVKRFVLAILVPLFIGISVYSIYHFKKGSVDGRVLIWRVTSNIIGENPLFGVGHDRFKTHYMNAQADYFEKRGETEEAMLADNTYYAFNEVLQFISENGMMGLLLAFVTLFCVVRLIPSYDVGFLQAMSIGALMGVFIFGLFSYPAQILPIKMIGVFALAMLVNIDIAKTSIGRLFNNGYDMERYNIGLLKIVVSILCLMGICYGWRYIGKIECGYKGWKTAMDSYNYGLYEDSVAEFEKVYPALQNEGDFLMNFGKALVMAERFEKAVEILTQAKELLNTTIIETSLGDAHKALKSYNASEAAYQHASHMIPIRFYPHYLLVKLYQESGQEEKAVKKARAVLVKKVKVNSTAIKEIKSEMERIINTSPLESNDIKIQTKMNVQPLK